MMPDAMLNETIFASAEEFCGLVPLSQGTLTNR